MFVPFETLPESSKIWIYQSETKFSEAQKKDILEKATRFVDSWQSHGSDLKGSVKIIFDHFLILAVDDTFYSPSGCSIDKSVHFVNELEAELGIKLLDRSKQPFLVEDSVEFFPISKGRQLVQEGVLSASTKTFNNSIVSLAELERQWVIEAKESWLGKFFKNNN